MKTDEGNYTKTAKMARAQFLEADQLLIAARPGVTTDDAYFYVGFMDMIYRCARTTGLVERSVRGGPWEDASGFGPTMSVFDYLCLDRGERVLSGKWTTTEHLGLNTHGNRTGGGGFFSKEAAFLDAHKDALPDILEGIGGEAMPVGDAAYIVPAIGDLSVYFQFWESDDEFSARVIMLWDENALRYVHYETLFYIQELIFKRIGELLRPSMAHACE
ncbi:MAG: DUF3786 domain-containing protein [Clostridiales Family XIII bacterium]|jgi:hypothetical protein|nr:DUF3786 domain-containing protein [Clostridiales Family XIII bacterium]